MDDRLVIFTGAGEHRPATAADGDILDSLCQQIQFPTMYIADHWPIRVRAYPSCLFIISSPRRVTMRDILR